MYNCTSNMTNFSNLWNNCSADRTAVCHWSQSVHLRLMQASIILLNWSQCGFLLVSIYFPLCQTGSQWDCSAGRMAVSCWSQSIFLCPAREPMRLLRWSHGSFLLVTLCFLCSRRGAVCQEKEAGWELGGGRDQHRAEQAAQRLCWQVYAGSSTN